MDSTSVTSDIVFTGSDGLSCHEFIRAIREQALKSEKQTDNRWMADDASIRFGGDALKWFENLEDEVQTNWRLLRRAILSHYSEPAYAETIDSQSAQQGSSGLVFTGRNKAESRLFVREIRLRAAAEGKEKDSDWMVRLAYPCFAGDALEWHASLPADVRNDWERLERAILVNYPLPPTLAISPARIRIDNWFSAVPPSRSLQAIRSQADWLAQARERRRIGGFKMRKMARKRRENGASLPLGGKAIQNVEPFEVLVGDPSDFQWISIPEKPKSGRGIRHRPFMGVDAGFDGFHTASLVFQIRQDFGWHLGKAHTGQNLGYFTVGDKEECRATIVVLAWAD
ncbi:hypothetical protein FRC04_000681 [Tulasnella sp. 424]|nr:hypothetical protein FRC04_000681 [Tulasnella sp. 424]